MSSNLIKSEFESERPRAIKGSLVKYDDKKAPSWSFRDGTTWHERLRLIAINMTEANQKWVDGLPAATFFPDASGKLDDIEALNKAAPKKEWTRGFNNELKGPWVRQFVVRLLDPVSFSSFTFCNSTTGSRIAYELLDDKIGMARMIRGPVYPVVELADAPFKTKYGERRRPDFRVVDWVSFGSPELKDAGIKQIEHKAADETGLKSVPAPTTAELMNDAVPDFDDPTNDI
jgi:hypothetical protein